jgi:hypothetical protein
MNACRKAWIVRAIAAGLLGLAFLFRFTGTASAEDPAMPAQIEEVEYRGWKRNLKLSNGSAELIVTLDVGPRILSYHLVGEPSVLKEYDEQLGKSGEDSWMIRGGHRLWAAPEDPSRTYEPDNGPVEYRVNSGSVSFVTPPDPRHGLQKEIEVALAPSGSRVTLTHKIRNTGTQPTELAPWALTVMAPGGVEVIPLPEKRPHPGDPKNARSAADFAPNQTWILWPYTDLSDPRWKITDRYLSLSQKAGTSPTKIGLAHREGQVGYLLGSTLFVKEFGYEPGGRYPDGGVNFETFTNGDMLEMESLGPLVSLPPGQSVEHKEQWELFKVGTGNLETEVLPHLKGPQR